ncbi:hypothetical protein ESY86_16805 [Subsaximicrobium wynnwilliamsii]|uniref:GNAT family N-acetyltransferase n=1 Tax=Subsaximicrobium wynnwilliamsii TaxID=291179 RepID=A0A5C6ZCC0_9FLAO|nr:hypothetical protein [Subsaximicrobium wynnwilliamsii]TXD81684.1 hypothetical protein ESY87_17060 [Subsaximicrobium wynnwilliamsii]TXD87439.1 hypothetical protein ESY86_16805 [Subsaximicrobium wynnwilliamsii]TXE01127.1 hypothetical protein ESY88_17060 [Subsaximicrobium wynnwilliamsii]
MIKKIINNLKVRSIQSYVYRMETYVPYLEKEPFKFDLKIDRQSGRCTKYYIEKNDLLIHQSYIYNEVFLLRLIKKRGPVIGNCFTHPEFRGKSIYPYVINCIAKNSLNLGAKEVFVIVNQSNAGSIKGIEKAGFEKYVSIDTKRWLIFYIKPRVEYSKNILSK